MALEQPKEGGNYITFKPSIGLLTIKSDQNDSEARPRTYKDSKTEQEMVVYERQYKSLEGRVVGIEVDTTGDYGSQVKLTIRDGLTDYIFPLPLNKGWGTKIVEAIPNIKLDEDVFISAYGDFVADNGKEVQAGVSLKQGGVRVDSKFKSWSEEDGFTYSEGFPEVDQDAIPGDNAPAKKTKFWSDYFFSVGEFLENYINENHKLEVVPIEEDMTSVNPDEPAF